MRSDLAKQNGNPESGICTGENDLTSAQCRELMTETEVSKALFSGLKAVITPVFSAELVPLDDTEATGELGRFSEALLLATNPGREPSV